MKWSYYFKHWLTTVFLGSLILVYSMNSSSSFFTVSIEIYLFALLLSGFFSMPTFTVLAFVFNYLDEYEIDVKTVKTLLISITLLGVPLTQWIGLNDISLEITISYSLAAIISGMLFKLKRKDNHE
ncbi:hypothetical protein [Brumimicrobium sp.]|uniref:hypothetical protein n=1 Tax=Brumimicrobium sp. TaxID=2029867 RepID=UPI003A8E258C